MSSPESELAVYLAARYSRKDEIREKAEELSALGIEITSRWLWEPPSETGLGDESRARQDIEDMDKCKLFVLFSESPDEAFKRGGRHVETGYALGTKKPIIVVGPIENVFHHLRQIIKVSDWNELKANLKFLKQVNTIE